MYCVLCCWIGSDKPYSCLFNVRSLTIVIYLTLFVSDSKNEAKNTRWWRSSLFGGFVAGPSFSLLLLISFGCFVNWALPNVLNRLGTIWRSCRWVTKRNVDFFSCLCFVRCVVWFARILARVFLPDAALSIVQFLLTTSELVLCVDIRKKVNCAWSIQERKPR